MARTWMRGYLTGTRNGSNVNFTLPTLPDGTLTVEIIFNGKDLDEVGGGPDEQEYSRTGTAVTLGLAPNADDKLVYYIIAEDLEGEGAVALGLVQELRRTFYYTVEARDKAGLLQEILEKDISSSRWSYYPIGGCGEAEIVLRRPFDDFGDISLDWDLQIWRDTDVLGQAGARLPAQLPIQLGTAHAGGRELRWGGFVREIQRVLADDEQVILRCAGWSRQLAYIFIPEQSQSWQSRDVGSIVRDIIDRFVIPGTQINRTTSLNLVPDTGVIVNSINFDTTAFDAIRTLGEIAGNAEWGVRADKEFYFIQPSGTAKQTHVIGDRIALYRPATNADEIVKTVYLRGGNGFKATINAGEPEAGFYKQRREFVASIQSQELATLWGASYFARFSESQPSGQLVLGATDDWIENVGHPLGLLRVIGGPVFVSPGDALPAQLPVKLANIYGRYTDESFKIASVTYQPTDDALEVDIGLGQRKRALADLFETINYKLAELQQGMIL